MTTTEADPVGAFMPGARTTLPGAAGGPLAGLRFAVKDLYDVEGHPTTYGNPDWARTHPPAVATAPCILDLLRAGAGLVLAGIAAAALPDPGRHQHPDEESGQDADRVEPKIDRPQIEARGWRRRHRPMLR